VDWRGVKKGLVRKRKMKRKRSTSVFRTRRNVGTSLEKKKQARVRDRWREVGGGLGGEGGGEG